MESMRVKQEPDDSDARVTTLAPMRARRVLASTPNIKQEPQDESDLRFHPSDSTINRSNQQRFPTNPNTLPVASHRAFARGGSRFPATYTPQPARSVPAGPRSWPNAPLDPFGRAIRGFPDPEEQHARDVRRGAGHHNPRTPPAYGPSNGGLGARLPGARLPGTRCGNTCRGANGSGLTTVMQLSKECQIRGFNLKWLPQPVSDPSFCYHVGLLDHVVKTSLVSECDCRAKALVADKALDVVRAWPITKRAAGLDTPPNRIDSYRPGPLLADPRPADYYRPALPVPPEPKNTSSQERGGSGYGRDVPAAKQGRDAMADSRGGHTTAVAPGTKDGHTQEEAALLDQARRVMGISLPESSPDTPASRAFLEGLKVGARLSGVSPAAAAELPSRDPPRSPPRRVGADAHRRRSRSPPRRVGSRSFSRCVGPDAHRDRSRSLRRVGPDARRRRSYSPSRRVGPDAHRHRSALRERERLTPPPRHHRSPRGPDSDHWDSPPGARHRRFYLEPGRLTPPPRYDRPVRDYSDLYESWHPGNSCEAEGKWLHDRYQPDESGRRGYDWVFSSLHHDFSATLSGQRISSAHDFIRTADFHLHSV